MADVNTIMAELKRMNARLVYLEAQNKANGNSILKVPERTWQFPVWRTIRGKRTPIKVIDEFAVMKTKLAALERRIK